MQTDKTQYFGGRAPVVGQFGATHGTIIYSPSPRSARTASFPDPIPEVTEDTYEPSPTPSFMNNSLASLVPEAPADEPIDVPFEDRPQQRRRSCSPLAWVGSWLSWCFAYRQDADGRQSGL